MASEQTSGQVAGLWRYPVKSMQGEPLRSAEVTPAGLVGDRAWAVIDAETGQVGSAKHPRKWGPLLECSARTVGDEVEITLPDGSVVGAGPVGEEALSDLLGRSVLLRRPGEAGSSYEGIWPDIEGLAPEAFVRGTRVGDDAQGTLLGLQLAMAAPGTFLDVAALHIVTTASLAALAGLAPGVEPDAGRFRPNVLVDWPEQADGSGKTGDPETGFPEDTWAGRTVALGPVLAAGSMPTMRCIMTTLAQPGLAARPEVLRALARHHRVSIGNGMWACLGLYADVRRGGHLTVGDPVVLPAAAG